MRVVSKPSPTFFYFDHESTGTTTQQLLKLPAQQCIEQLAHDASKETPRPIVGVVNECPVLVDTWLMIAQDFAIHAST